MQIIVPCVLNTFGVVGSISTKNQLSGLLWLIKISNVIESLGKS